MRTPVISRSLPSFPSPMSRLCRLAGLAAGLALTGCSWMPSLPSLPESPTLRSAVTWLAPYKPDVVQGNVVTTEQIKLIKVGMTRAQVRDVLGSPLIADAFHAQRWDYIFTLQRQGYEPIKRALVVSFDKDAVSKVDAPDLPSESDFVASISRTPLPTHSPKLELTDGERSALPAPKPLPASATAASAAAGATRTYPPLEPQTP